VPPGGQKLYAGYEDGAVRQFDGASGTLEYEFRGHTDGVTTLWVEASMPHPEDPNSVEMVLYSGSYDHSVRCWDLQGTQKYLEYVNAKRAEEERLERERAEEMARLEAEASKGSKKEGKKKKK
jgi:WD40 repeat protein